MLLQGPKRGEPICLPRLLDIGLGPKPEDPALISAENSWSWRELDRASERYASGLLASR